MDLPGGLKELHELKHFRFDTGSPSLQLTKPLAELLPVDNLEQLRLGRTTFDCRACGIPRHGGYGCWVCWNICDLHREASA